MARVSSQKSSFQHLYDAPLQRRTSPIDDNITSHVCGFCATSLGVWSSSRSTHQATLQSFPAGTSGATQNHAQVGPSSCAISIAEAAIRIRRMTSFLGWRHSPKMADHEMCVPVGFGFGETALIPARIPYMKIPADNQVIKSHKWKFAKDGSNCPWQYLRVLITGSLSYLYSWLLSTLFYGHRGISHKLLT